MCCVVLVVCLCLWPVSLLARCVCVCVCVCICMHLRFLFDAVGGSCARVFGLTLNPKTLTLTHRWAVCCGSLLARPRTGSAAGPTTRALSRWWAWRATSSGWATGTRATSCWTDSRPKFCTSTLGTASRCEWRCEWQLRNRNPRSKNRSQTSRPTHVQDSAHRLWGLLRGVNGCCEWQLSNRNHISKNRSQTSRPTHVQNSAHRLWGLLRGVNGAVNGNWAIGTIYPRIDLKLQDRLTSKILHIDFGDCFEVIYIYIYMCVCVCVCICLFICIYIYMYIYVYVYLDIDI